ncbi:MAG: tail fiber domain-containing protein [Bacteroidales bacterium]
MRKVIFLVAVAVSLTISMNAQIRMESWGAVQIGTIGQNQGLGVGRPQWIGRLDVADGARIGNITSLYHSGRYGKYGEAVPYDFNPNGGNGGLIMEQGNSESAGIYLDGDYAVIWSPGDQGYLLKVIDEDLMQLRWYINGSGYAYTNSDKNRKENIVKINGSLSKIKGLSGVTYNFIKTNEEKLKNDSIITGTKEYSGNKNVFKEKIEKKESGFIAQDLEKIIPEVVETNEKGEKFINYDGIIPYLVEGMKEQQMIIESLQSEIQELKKNLGSGSKLKSVTINSGTTYLQENPTNMANILYQNSPNPFSQNTTIEYFITENIQKAMICIYDMNGTQLKCIQLHHTGYGNITINGSEFKAGMYMYALIIDGQLIDTKKMVLTD